MGINAAPGVCTVMPSVTVKEVRGDFRALNYGDQSIARKEFSIPQ